MKGKQYYIVVKNQKIYVDIKVYKIYHKELNHEKYEERKYKKNTNSIDYDIDYHKNDDFEEEIIKEILIDKLYKTIEKLSEEEKIIINQLYFEKKSERNLALELNLTQGVIHARKINIIKKLKKLMKI